MSELIIYRGGVRDEDGVPVLERTVWRADPEGVTIAGQGGTWAFVQGGPFLSEPPMVAAETTVFGDIITPGGLQQPVNPLSAPTKEGHTLLTRSQFVEAWNDYEGTEPVTISERDLPLYLDPPVN